MRPFPLAVQLHSLREQCRADFAGTLKQVAQWGYRAIEFAGLYGHSPQDVRKMLDDTSLIAIGAHGVVPGNQAEIAKVEEEANILGYKRFICGPRFETMESVEAVLGMAHRYGFAARHLKTAGIEFGLHNHEWEFTRGFHGKTLHELLRMYVPAAFFELDTYWIKFGGMDPADVIRACAGRVPLLHIKDGVFSDDRTMTAVGAGKMEWELVMAAADGSKVEYLVVELDECRTDMATAVRESREWLVRKGYGKG